MIATFGLNIIRIRLVLTSQTAKKHADGCHTTFYQCHALEVEYAEMSLGKVYRAALCLFTLFVLRPEDQADRGHLIRDLGIIKHRILEHDIDNGNIAAELAQTVHQRVHLALV